MVGRPDRGLRGLACALGRGVARREGNASRCIYLRDYHAAERGGTHSWHDIWADSGQCDVSQTSSGILVIANHGSLRYLLAGTATPLAQRKDGDRLSVLHDRFYLAPSGDKPVNPGWNSDSAACHLEFSLGFCRYNLS